MSVIIMATLIKSSSNDFKSSSASPVPLYGIPKQTKFQTRSKQLSNRFSSETIVKCVQNNCPNLVDESVVELVCDNFVYFEIP